MIPARTLECFFLVYVLSFTFAFVASVVRSRFRG